MIGLGERAFDAPAGTVWKSLIPNRMAAKRVATAKTGTDARDERRTPVPQRHTTMIAGGEGDELYRTLVDHLAVMVFRKDLAGRFVFANSRFCSWMNRPREEILGRTDFDIYPRELAERLAIDDRRALATGDTALGARVYEFAGLQPSQARIARVPIRDANGTIIGLHGIISEVVDEVQRALEEQAFFLRTLLDNIPDNIYFKDEQSRFRSISRYCARKHGASDPADMTGKTDFDYFAGEHAEQAFRDEQEIMRTGVPKVNIEEKETFPDGSIKWCTTTKMPLRDAQGRIIGTFGVSRDITERKQMEEQLARQAFYDGLTALPNRALFGNRLEHLFRRSSRGGREFLFAVLYLDVDRFKGVNDSLGHQAGDDLLVLVARRLEACLRPSDTLARLGGDDFAIVLEDLRAARDVTRVAERIHEQLVAPFTIQGHDVFCSASIGIALSTSGYERPEDMLRDADTAMYRAKSNGGGRHEIFDADMHRRAVSRLKLETDLRRAIERQEFVVYYQPIIDLEQHLLTGFEALVRWRHPQRGLVPPGDFIPIAEETGLIGPIGLWVLSEACRQGRAWHTKFPGRPPVRMSVNLSGHQLTNPALVDQIRLTLAETELDPGSLTVEITEGAIVRDMAVGAAAMEKLRALGIQLNVDDFGTGYSSLSYLQNLPIDALKIDRSFVCRIGRDGKKSEIVHAIITLAHSLGMKVVAEGVETRDQLDALMALRCNSAQGFFFARPVPAEDAERLLTDGLPAF